MRPTLTEDIITLRSPVLAGMSEDAFFDFCQLNADLRIERTTDHKILLMSPTGSRAGKRNARLNGQLYTWFSHCPEPGETFGSNTGFTLPDGSVLSPDASWVSAAKWHALTTAQQDKFAPVCPEFVVELKSAPDSRKALQAKMLDYLRNGPRLAWLLNPETETAYLYHPAQPEPEPETVQGFDNELSGEPVLPGFRLRLAELR